MINIRANLPKLPKLPKIAIQKAAPTPGQQPQLLKARQALPMLMRRQGSAAIAPRPQTSFSGISSSAAALKRQPAGRQLGNQQSAKAPLARQPVTKQLGSKQKFRGPQLAEKNMTARTTTEAKQKQGASKGYGQRYTISNIGDEVVDPREKTIERGHKIQAHQYKVPLENQFKLSSNNSNFEFRGNSLSKVTLQDRIDIHGHGGKDNFGGMKPKAMANYLESVGLKKVGVLKFSACNVGKGNFLNELGKELASKGIEVGYLSGPKGMIVDQRTPISIKGKQYNVRDTPMRKTVLRGNLPVPEKFGLKVVKGNAEADFPNTRYQKSKNYPGIFGNQSANQTSETANTKPRD